MMAPKQAAPAVCRFQKSIRSSYRCPSVSNRWSIARPKRAAPSDIPPPRDDSGADEERRSRPTGHYLHLGDRYERRCHHKEELRPTSSHAAAQEPSPHESHPDTAYQPGHRATILGRILGRRSCRVGWTGFISRPNPSPDGYTAATDPGRGPAVTLAVIVGSRVLARSTMEKTFLRAASE